MTPAFWRAIEDLQRDVKALAERLDALEAKRLPGRPRKVEEAA